MELDYKSCLSIKNQDICINIDQARQDSTDIISLITHGHSDHVTNTPQKTLATEETIAFINSRIKNSKFDFAKVNYNKKIKLTDNLTLKPLNAGHILGSSMFYFEADGKTVLYTGDINTKDSLLLKGAEPLNADILMIESMFGKKEYSFPDRSDVYDSFAGKLKTDLAKNKFIILGGYALGKSQELIAFVNSYLGEAPLANNLVYANSEIYKGFGSNLGNYELLDHNLSDYNVLVMPLSLINKDLISSLKHQLGRDVISYIATGWNYGRNSNVVHVSDHADYQGLLDFIVQVEPKQVYTMHGFSEDLARSVQKELGISARSIEDISQKSLNEF